MEKELAFRPAVDFNTVSKAAWRRPLLQYEVVMKLSWSRTYVSPNCSSWNESFHQQHGRIRGQRLYYSRCRPNPIHIVQTSNKFSFGNSQEQLMLRRLGTKTSLTSDTGCCCCSPWQLLQQPLAPIQWPQVPFLTPFVNMENSNTTVSYRNGSLLVIHSAELSMLPNNRYCGFPEMLELCHLLQMGWETTRPYDFSTDSDTKKLF